MANKYKNVPYFESRPDIVRLFDDLEKLHNFCRMEMLPFNEADLYNKTSPIWAQYLNSTRPRRPRGDYAREGGYNRSGDNRNNNRSFQRR